MNKAFIGILIAVCILGMALIMLNEWKSSKNDPEPASPALEASPATPDGLPSHTGSSLTPPVPGDAAAPAPVETAPAAEAPAATPPSEALERGFAFNDTEAVPPQDMPLPVTEGAARPAQDVPPQPALGSGAASEPPAAPSVPAATETRQPPAAEVEPAAPEKKEEKKAEKPAPAAKARTVTRFVVFARETGATVRIEGSSPIEYKYLPLDNPPWGNGRSRRRACRRIRRSPMFVSASWTAGRGWSSTSPARARYGISFPRTASGWMCASTADGSPSFVIKKDA